jgi:hypothetical protein
VWLESNFSEARDSSEEAYRLKMPVGETADRKFNGDDDFWPTINAGMFYSLLIKIPGVRRKKKVRVLYAYKIGCGTKLVIFSYQGTMKLERLVYNVKNAGYFFIVFFFTLPLSSVLSFSLSVEGARGGILYVCAVKCYGRCNFTLLYFVRELFCFFRLRYNTRIQEG